VNALQVAVGDGEVTSDSSTGSEDDGIILATEGVERDLALLANSDTSLEGDTLRGHEVDTALNDLLVEFHVGNTVHEETANTISTLVDSDAVASLVELISASKTSGTRSDNGNGLARAILGRRRDHPAHLETTINDGALDRLDTDGILVDAENASTLTGSRADTTGELWEVVGLESVSYVMKRKPGGYIP
jgi:hypothetical protein